MPNIIEYLEAIDTHTTEEILEIKKEMETDKSFGAVMARCAINAVLKHRGEEVH